MAFKDLRGLTETDEQKKSAADGFEERLKLHEMKFAAESKSLEPGDKWLERSYDL